MSNPAVFIIEIIISLLVLAYVVNHSEGRISRNEFWKMKLAMFLGFIGYWCLAIWLSFNASGILVVIGLFATPFFCFKWMQVSIRRLHDLNYSGWMLLFEYVPIVNLYFIFKRWLENSSDGLNDYDISISYADFLKKSGLYPNVNCIELLGRDFSVNSVHFEYKKFNGKEIFECSSLALDSDSVVKNYFEEHFEKAENAPSYAEKYRVSFVKKEHQIEDLKRNLHAILIRNGYLLIDENEIFVQNDGFSYALVYEKDKFIVELDRFSKTDTGEHNLITLKKAQFRELIESLV